MAACDRTTGSGNQLNVAVGIFDRMPGIKRVPFFRFSLMLARPDDCRPIRHSASQWSAPGRIDRIALVTS